MRIPLALHDHEPDGDLHVLQSLINPAKGLVDLDQSLMHLCILLEQLLNMLSKLRLVKSQNVREESTFICRADKSLMNSAGFWLGHRSWQLSGVWRSVQTRMCV